MKVEKVPAPPPPSMQMRFARDNREYQDNLFWGLIFCSKTDNICFYAFSLQSIEESL
jgi:hypothetical protein